MEELEVTLDRVVKVWWLQTWRVATAAMAYSGVHELAVQYAPDAAPYVRAIGVILMLGWNLKVTKAALLKKYEDFRIVLVPLKAD